MLALEIMRIKKEEQYFVPLFYGYTFLIKKRNLQKMIILYLFV